MKTNHIYQGEAQEELSKMEENSVETIITDPPYGISFMGKKWDYDVPSTELWKECLRVLKPGGTALIFAGSRTQHRMAVNVEDAGFILKDCIMWLYGSGFPKATDISKQLDKKQGTYKKGEVLPSSRKVKGNMDFHMKEKTANNPQSPEAKLWNGWKSHGLKPAYEPILVAMKPNDGTYANNALKHGVSGLNIDGGRVGKKDGDRTEYGRDKEIPHNNNTNSIGNFKTNTPYIPNEQGRFPANIILDEEAGEMLDEQSGVTKSSDSKRTRKTLGSFGMPNDATPEYNDKGGASRFFYCAKASKAERNAGCEELEEVSDSKMTNRKEGSDGLDWNDGKGGNAFAGASSSRGTDRKNHHPTVKPLALMEYLCKLTQTPTGGVVLDPFMGSGTTLIAAKKLGRPYIGIEREKEYVEIAEARIKAWEKDSQEQLF